MPTSPSTQTEQSARFQHTASSARHGGGQASPESNLKIASHMDRPKNVIDGLERLLGSRVVLRPGNQYK